MPYTVSKAIAVMGTLGQQRATAIALLLLILDLSSARAAPSIFDEDWTPPKAISHPKPAAPPIEPAPATRSATPPVLVSPAPGTPPANPKPAVVVPPVVAVPTPVPQPARLAIPGKPEQTRSRKLMQEVYADQLADRSQAGRRKLADQLLTEAGKLAKTSPTDAYVVLAGAIKASKESASLKLCGKAADALADLFEVDELAVKVDAALEMKYAGSPPAELADNINSGLELVDRLIAADDLVSAGKLSAVLQAGANSPALRATAQAKARDVNALKTARERVQASLDKLKTTSDDPTANLVAGSYYCFSRKQWDIGLPMLSRGSNPTLKSLAASELSGADTSAKQIALADAWWTAAEKEQPTIQFAIREHAAAWYEAALSDKGLAGLNRARVEKRVASVAISRETTEQRMYRSIAASVKDGLVDKTIHVGPVEGKPSNKFAKYTTNLPEQGAILTGFVVTPGELWKKPAIKGVRPIYQTAQGRIEGEPLLCGLNRDGEDVVLEARTGYAVGGMVAKGTDVIYGFKLIYMRIRSDKGLDPNDRYESDWVGGKGGTAEKTLGGDGRFVVGVYTVTGFEGVSLIQVRAAR